MPTINEILGGDLAEKERIEALQQKTLNVPSWGGRHGLQMQYDPTMHPVMDKCRYPDIVRDEGIEFVTRITLDFQRLAAKRMSELV